MTQQALIDRLRKVEEALAMFAGKAKHTINGADESCFIIGMREQVSYGQMLAAATALSDLRELIKEAERQKAAARTVAEVTNTGYVYIKAIDRTIQSKTPLYTALGEKP